MLSLMKAQLAEFSYFLEKYFGLTSIIWSILFMSFCYALFFALVTKIIEYILHKKKKKEYNLYYLCAIFTAVFGYMMNILITQVYTWNSKLQRVMSNFNYVLSFDSSRKAFLNALSLPDNAVNKKNLFVIAMYLDDKQWKGISKSLGDGGWYFEKIQKSLGQILKIGKMHLSLGVIYQGMSAYIPLVMIIALGIILLIKKYKIAGVLVFACGVICLFNNLGSNIFIAITLYLSVIFYLYFGRVFSVWKNILMVQKKLKSLMNVKRSRDFFCTNRNI